MKLVLQIAGGMLLAGLVLTVVGVACVALFASGVKDAVTNYEATRTAVALSRPPLSPPFAATPVVP